MTRTAAEESRMTQLRKAWPIVVLAIAAASAAAALVAYWAGAGTQALGGFAALALLAGGVGLSGWARTAMPDEPATGPREPLASSPEDREAFVTTFRRGEESIGRRRILQGSLWALTAGLVATGLSLFRSLGPSPLPALRRTSWRRGLRLVTTDGVPIQAEDLRAGGVLTVYPEGHVGEPDSQTLLIRVLPNELELEPERLAQTHEGIVAYSKVCTHAACPVGLYQEEQKLLLCPCHQSTFDVVRGAEPTSGPATRALPQLPIAADGEGYLVAQGDFPTPVGPGFWSLPR
jgi:ubiquinol-cytochrome c reductase iron-sulfur subunit